ncbi:preprotein translocase subunit SecE [Clostridium saccharoperbutylacetonicum]|uniref:Protein translocase subunit SecE n=1 Tax=Clostridium saccharoperbutylacetonicum N1-4(HMT) TaxID=931276 RepID=M1MC21_9CLOT|nr:preprotein translocase subunit SecE [Clostridium saccharoperbutylacetonicum]AGF53993.1 preprotein translocase, SecE subunit, bacterial [Clostridium saccharoperbutylacetonicum N1-4(HMT)]NRT59494.1 preprotein translocase subunit SecE [Clostridium saccharoperbutylacetonicum]NSB28686.1 preprotein translocase subunit SecE [Clostridium saccharoperbutylacetonicum]NSB42177.1 preprotein translocase subunit SecE [Clostridium saccharoperbutylacetonicum]
MSVKDNAKTEKAVKNNGLLGFFREVKVEVKKKITWPSKDETKKAFIAVITFTLMYTILVGGFDFIFRNLFDMFLKLK